MSPLVITRTSNDLGLLRLREQNADRYLHRARPAIVGLGFAIAVASSIINPTESIRTELLLVAFSAAVTVLAMIGSRFIPILVVVNTTIVLDVLALYAFISVSHAPETTVMVLLWPVIALGYFASPHAALALAVTASASCFWMQAQDVQWADEGGVPAGAYVLLISGLLIWFVTREGRRIEQALASDRASGHRALELSRLIGLSSDPDDALTRIARELSLETGAQQAVAALFGREDDFVDDIVSWSAAGISAPSAALVDASLRHLAATGTWLSCERGELQLLDQELAPIETGTTDQPAARALYPPLIALLGPGSGSDPRSGVLCPLMLGERPVGFLLLEGPSAAGWTDATVEMLALLAPQLAAGLAQAVLVRDQRDALAALQHVDEMRDRLIASVSHELRTPLTSTIGFIETLLRDDVELSAAMRIELMEHARDGGQRLLSLVEDLLTLGTTRPDSLDLQREPVALSELLAEALCGIPAPAERLIRVSVRQDDAVVVDRNRALQVITNLVNNAIRHGAGDVDVICDAAGHDAIIDVLDDGDGIDERNLRELFLPFARFSMRTDSTGLGLAICRTIVEAHGGTISYTRTSDARTRFRVRLPVITEPT